MMTIDEMMNDMMDAVKISYPERKKRDPIDKRVRKYMGIPFQSGQVAVQFHAYGAKAAERQGLIMLNFFLV